MMRIILYACALGWFGELQVTSVPVPGPAVGIPQLLVEYPGLASYIANMIQCIQNGGCANEEELMTSTPTTLTVDDITTPVRKTKVVSMETSGKSSKDKESVVMVTGDPLSARESSAKAAPDRDVASVVTSDVTALVHEDNTTDTRDDKSPTHSKSDLELDLQSLTSEEINNNHSKNGSRKLDTPKTLVGNFVTLSDSGTFLTSSDTPGSDVVSTFSPEVKPNKVIIINSNPNGREQASQDDTIADENVRSGLTPSERLLLNLLDRILTDKSGGS